METLQRGFAGFTKYYTASVWLGFDVEAYGNDKVNANSTMSANLFKAVMTPVHEGKPSASWEQPAGITTANICKVSGQLAGELCPIDPRGSKVYTEYFAVGTVPKNTCSVHQKVKICEVSGKLASEKCKKTVEKVCITRENADSNTAWRSAADAAYMAPTETCTTCTGTETTEQNEVTNQNVSDNSIVSGNNTSKDRNNTNKNSIVSGNNTVGGGNKNTTYTNTSARNNSVY